MRSIEICRWLSFRRLLYLSCAIYFISLLTGVILGIFSDFLFVAITETYSDKGEASTASTFLNNLQVSIAAILLGVLYGVVPLVILLTNGFILGYIVATIQFHAPDFPPLGLLYGLAPHGVLEVPLLIFSCALGFRLFVLYRRYRNNIAGSSLRKESAVLLVCLPVITLLIYLAAYLEVNVSMVLLENLIHG